MSEEVVQGPLLSLLEGALAGAEAGRLRIEGQMGLRAGPGLDKGLSAVRGSVEGCSHV